MEGWTEGGREGGSGDDGSELPPRALKCLLNKNFFWIGAETNQGIYIRHLIGRSLRVHSERSAELPDKRFWGVSYYEKVVRSKIIISMMFSYKRVAKLQYVPVMFILNTYVVNMGNFTL